MPAATQQETVTYQFKPNSRLKGDPQEIGEFIQSLYEKHQEISPEIVEKAARPVNNCLHTNFTWNEKEAAYKCRIDEARYLLRHLIFLPAGEEQKPEPIMVRAVFALGTNEREWLPTRVILESDEDTARLLRMALRELGMFRKKYAMLRAVVSELTPLFQMIERLESKFASGENGKEENPATE